MQSVTYITREQITVANKQRISCYPSLVPMQACTVAFCDPSGVRHVAEVTAESLYEAAVVGVRAISEQWAAEPGSMTRIEVQVRGPAVRHELTLGQVRRWLESSTASPKERILKDRLRQLLP